MELVYNVFEKRESELASKFNYAGFFKDESGIAKAFLCNDIKEFNDKDIDNKKSIFKSNKVEKNVFDFNELVKRYN